MVADSRDARLVFVGIVPRTYAVPVDALRREALVGDGRRRDHPTLGRIRELDLDVGGRRVEGAVRVVEDTPEGAPDLEGLAVLRWDAMDEWYEEDEPVYVHPHDPWHRIDIRESSRHVVVEVDGERVAESRRPTLLFETHLPVRYYLPHVDVRLDLLRESDAETGCAYKGFAGYVDLKAGRATHENLVWTYRAPFPEGAKVRGLLAFFNERVDITVDGEPQERVRTRWSDAAAVREPLGET